MFLRLCFLLSAVLFAAAPPAAQAHCQIPCGIYDDQRAFAEMKQHAVTIERSLRGLSESKTMHDSARWTMNKEQHAQKIQDMAQSYFLAQRVKVADEGSKAYPNYVTSATGLHKIIVAAMKAKQTTDEAAVSALEEAINAYEAHYWSMHGHDHKK
jgi:hypothetical protein